MPLFHTLSSLPTCGGRDAHTVHQLRTYIQVHCLHYNTHTGRQTDRQTDRRTNVPVAATVAKLWRPCRYNHCQHHVLPADTMYCLPTPPAADTASSLHVLRGFVERQTNRQTETLERLKETHSVGAGNRHSGGKTLHTDSLTS